MNDLIEFLICCTVAYTVICIGLLLNNNNFGEECRFRGGAPMSTQYGDRCVYNYKLN